MSMVGDTQAWAARSARLTIGQAAAIAKRRKAALGQSAPHWSIATHDKQQQWTHAVAEPTSVRDSSKRLHPRWKPCRASEGTYDTVSAIGHCRELAALAGATDYGAILLFVETRARSGTAGRRPMARRARYMGLVKRSKLHSRHCEVSPALTFHLP